MSPKGLIAIMLVTLMNCNATYGFNESDFEIYPLSTKMMPGNGDVTQSNVVPMAVFIIGDDEKSIKWARKNKSLLEKHNAIGFIVSANDDSSLNYISRVLPNNRLFIGDGDEFSSTFQIKTYPVLLLPEQVGG
jgi:integrating conjugative element protein (TIGR03765 family)